MKYTLPLLTALIASPVFAEGTREMAAHVHGVGALNIAFDQGTIAMEFHAPGADIVGFEYAAKTDADLAAIKTAIATLETPNTVFTLPEGANCTLTESHAALKSEGDETHGHDDHKTHNHDAHDHDDHKKDDHAGHNHDAHKEHDHGDHAAQEAGGHTEFHAHYALTCANPDAIDAIDAIAFPYFATFANAETLKVQVITAQGAAAYDVTRDAPNLALKAQ